MSYLFNNGSPNKKRLDLGLQKDLQSSNESARPIPWLFGRRRLGLTFISEAFDIKADSVNSGGKGGASTGKNYYASFAALACLGPVDIFHDIYLNQDACFVSNTRITIISLFNNGTLATAQTASAHGLTTGDQVEIYGAAQPQFNGEFPVTVINATQFAYTIPGATLNLQAKGTINGNIYARQQLDPVARPGDNSVITIPDYGLVTMYWGTETQQPDQYLNNTTQYPFTALRGICYFVFKQLFLGFNQTSVQNIEVVLERCPKPAWLLDPAHYNINGDANPAAVILEILQHPRAGIGLANAEINFQSLAAAAAQFYADSAGLSRIVTELNDARSMISEICETVGAQPIIDSQGRFALTLLRKPAPGFTPPAIADAQLSGLPEVEASDWTSTNTETRLKYDDRDNAFNPDVVEYKDLSTYQINGMPNPLSLDRPWMAQRDVALAVVAAAGRIASLPPITGKTNLLFDAAVYAELQPGSLFSLSYSLRPEPVTYRVTSRTFPDPAKPEFQIEFAIDRGYLFGSAVINTATAPEGAVAVAAAAAQTTPVRIVELPPALSSTAALAVLSARPDAATTIAAVNVARNFSLQGIPTESYQQLTTLPAFAWHGRLTADYPSATNTIDLSGQFTLQLDGPDLILDEITDADALAGVLLIFAGDEILSVASVTLVAAGGYQLGVTRGKFGSPISGHVSGEEVFIIRRADLRPLIHPTFNPGATTQLKVVYGSAPIEDVDAISYTLSGRHWNTPPPAKVACNGYDALTQIIPAAASLDISWVLPDPGATMDRSDVIKPSTLLEFLVGGAIVHTETVAWPATSATFAWSSFSLGSPAAFRLRASTVIIAGDVIVPGRSAGSSLRSLVVTPAGLADDSFVIYVNGVPIRDLDNASGTDPASFDILGLAYAAGVTVEVADTISFATRDNFGSWWETWEWTAVATFSDGSQATFTGGTNSGLVTSDPGPYPLYYPNGSFKIARP